MPFRLHFLFLVLLLIPAGSALALPGKKDDGGTVFFEKQIRPILVEHCYECHSEAEDERKGGLLLDREKGWLEGGDTGKAVKAQRIEEMQEKLNQKIDDVREKFAGDISDLKKAVKSNNRE